MYKKINYDLLQHSKRAHGLVNLCKPITNGIPTPHPKKKNLAQLILANP